MTYLAVLMMVPFMIFAQKTTPDSEKNEFSVISQQGSLFSLKVVPGNPIKIFVLGRESAEIDISNIDLSAELDVSDLSISIRQVGKTNGPFLKIKKVKKHFELVEPLKMSTETVLEMKAQQKDKEETFKVKIAPLK